MNGKLAAWNRRDTRDAAPFDPRAARHHLSEQPAEQHERRQHGGRESGAAVTIQLRQVLEELGEERRLEFHVSGQEEHVAAIRDPAQHHRDAHDRKVARDLARRDGVVNLGLGRGTNGLVDMDGLQPRCGHKGRSRRARSTPSANRTPTRAPR
jgi:hypothetical protein